MASPKARGVALTGAAMAITVVGARYGAQMKDAEVVKEETKASVEAGDDRQIALLEARRTRLLGQRAALQGKIQQIEERQAQNAEEARKARLVTQKDTT